MQMRTNLTLYHLSYDPIPQFELRVPEHRLASEDAVTKRICLAPSIEDCINAKPGRGRTVQVALERGIPLVVYVYKAEIPRDASWLIRPVTIYKEYHVEDAIHNQEYWVTEIPKFEEQMLLVNDADLQEIANGPCPTVRAITTHSIAELPEFCAQACARTANKRLSRVYSTDTILMHLPELEEKAGVEVFQSADVFKAVIQDDEL